MMVAESNPDLTCQLPPCYQSAPACCKKQSSSPVRCRQCTTFSCVCSPPLQSLQQYQHQHTSVQRLTLVAGIGLEGFPQKCYTCLVRGYNCPRGRKKHPKSWYACCPRYTPPCQRKDLVMRLQLEWNSETAVGASGSLLKTQNALLAASDVR